MNKTNHWTSYDIAYKLFEDMLLNLYISDPRSYEHYQLVVDIRPEKDSGPCLNPWPLRYRCSALPTELTSQVGARYHFDPKFIKYCILKERARSLLFLWGAGGGGGGGKPALGRLANFPRSIREICDHLPFFPIIIRPFYTSWCILSWLKIQVSDETFQSRNEGFSKVFSDEKQLFLGYLLPSWIT